MTVQRKTARDLRMEQEEAEYAEMERRYIEAGGKVDKWTVQPLEPVAPQQETKPEDALSPDEANWKTRYGDLRRYSDSLQREAAAREKALRDELAALKRQENAVLPETLEEAREWVEKYPDLARIIKALIREDLQMTEEATAARFEELEQERYQIAKEKALNTILKTHSDFIEIINDPEFRVWLDKQPQERGRMGQAIYDALENDIDPKAAIEAINVYKSDMKREKAPKRNPEREAAMSVTRSSSTAPAPAGGKRVFKESEIESMSIQEYEKLEDEIDQARYEGRIIYDVRGAAM